MNSLFTQRRAKLLALKALRDGQTPAAGVSEPSRVACTSCGFSCTKGELGQAQYVCPNCNHHFPVGAYYRLRTILDAGTFKELHERVRTSVPLDFPGYSPKLEKARQTTGLDEAVVSAVGKIDGHSAVVCVMDSRFFMGSMSSTVGEKITLAVEYASRKHLPLVIFSASGGARMQEGIFSLMQMAKTSAAIGQFAQKGGLFISVFTHPTTGGVTASFASLGDITLAEPGALIGFAGPRVIQQTIGQSLPEGFQRAEYLLDHGFVDAIVQRSEMREQLAKLLSLHKKGGLR